MNPLSIKDALKLYKLLSPHLPEITEEETGLSFIGKIVNNIVASGKHQDYIEAVALMNGLPMEMIIKDMSIDEILFDFTEGLQINQILSLQGFCKKVGFDV